MQWRRVLIGVLAFAGCAQPTTGFEGAPLGAVQRLPPIDEGAVPQGSPVSATVAALSDRQSLWPVKPHPVQVTAQANVEQVVPVPSLPWSTRAALVRFGVAQPLTLTIGGVERQVVDGSTLAVPVTERALRFTSAGNGPVSLQVVATLDTAGGGFTPSQAPASEHAVTARHRFADAPGGTLPDDTFARVLSVEASSTQASQVLVGPCAPDDAVSDLDGVLAVPENGAAQLTVWTSAGDVCVNTTTPATVTVRELGRVRRFADTALRPITPVTLLDTARGTGGWKGTPLVGQSLRVALDGLRDDGATHRLLHVATSPAGRVKVGLCDGERQVVQSGNAVLVAKGDVCVEALQRVDVQLSAWAVVQARTDALSCEGETRAPLPACNESTVLGRLNCLPGVTATPHQSNWPVPGTQQYLLSITQPADHFHPDGQTFTQRALLTFRDVHAPTVLHTTGYELFEYRSDLSSNFPTNEIELEHRFFETSTPRPMDYGLLTIMQSAADSHRVVELLSPLLDGKWMNTGHSKGGMTALYHRRFFPCDVVASAPYVTPLSLGRQDARYGPWLAELGGPQYAACRQVTFDLEAGVMAKRAQYAAQLQGRYTRVNGAMNALWLANGGKLLWGVFQQGAQEDARQGCPAYEALAGSPDFPAYVDDFSRYGEAYSDEYLAQGVLDSYSYQTQNELGSPGSNRAHLEAYGPIPQDLPDDGELLFNDVALPDFEPRAMQDVQRWLKAHGTRFVFLYGGFDPWTGGQVDVTGATDTVKVVVPGLHHGVGLRDLTGATSDEVVGMLEGWLGVQRSKRSNAKRLPTEPPEYRDVMHRHAL